MPNDATERSRLDALARYRFPCDREKELFDRVTRLAAQAFAAPMSALSLVGSDEISFLSHFGLEDRIASRDLAFCAEAICEPEALVLPDAALDPRFAGNPWVTADPFIRFYAGVPLRTPDGFAIGALAVLDRQPRPQPSAEQMQGLTDLAVLAMETLRLQQEVRAGEERWQMALHGSHDGLWDFDLVKGVGAYSERFLELLGYSSGDLADTPEAWHSLVHPDDLGLVNARLHEYLNCLTPSFECQYRMRVKQGGWRWVLAKGLAVWSADGRPARLVGSQKDITGRKTLEAQAGREPLHDPLTGLANQRLITRKLAIEVRHADHTGHSLSVAVWELNRFAEIAVEKGRHAAELVLTTLGRLLSDSVRRDDLVGILDHHHFCVVLPNTTAAQTVACCERIKRKLTEQRFSDDRAGTFGVRATCGVASLEPGLDGAKLIDEALKTLLRTKKAADRLLISR